MLVSLCRWALLAIVAMAGSAWAQPETIDAELIAHLKNSVEASSSFEDRYDAQVWLVSKDPPLSKFIEDEEYRTYILKAVHSAATHAQLSPEIVLALIEVESHFDRFAVSRVGAQGMMQIMPFWKKEIGHPDDNLTDVDTNLRYGCAILKYYLDREEGVWRRALARYNGSVGKNWYPERVLNAWADRWR